MATPYSSINEMFLRKIDDPTFIEISRGMAEDEMLGYMQQAVANFKYPRVDIQDRDDFVGEFNQNLSYAEIEVISTLMKAAWARRNIMSLENIKIQYGERDFNRTPQAPMLNALMRLNESIEREVEMALWNYSTTENHKPSSIFGKLAGKEEV